MFLINIFNYNNHIFVDLQNKTVFMRHKGIEPIMIF